MWQLGGLALGALLLLLLAVHLFRSNGRSWSGPFGPSHGTLGGALAALAAAGGAGWWLYLELDHLAARMGVPLIFLLGSWAQRSRKGAEPAAERDIVSAAPQLLVVSAVRSLGVRSRRSGH